MESSEFILDCKNPEEWLKSSVALRTSAKAVWDVSHKMCQESLIPGTSDIDSLKFREHFKVMLNSQYFYSMSLECALKGYIAKFCPSNFQVVKKEKDGIEYASFEGILGAKRNSHDLTLLAKAADVFDSLKLKEKEILNYCTHLVVWLGRYHVPKSTKLDISRSGKLDRFDTSDRFPLIVEPIIENLQKKIKT